MIFRISSRSIRRYTPSIKVNVMNLHFINDEAGMLSFVLKLHPLYGSQVDVDFATLAHQLWTMSTSLSALLLRFTI